MFVHTLKLSARALRQDAARTLLMVVAIGLGIGAAMTSATVFRALAANPAAHKEGRLLIVQLDHWVAGSPYVETGEPPKQLTYQDAVALWEARKARRQALMYVNELAVQSAGLPPFYTKARLTTADFFPMFETPLLYGSGWDVAADADGTPVAVISRALNERVFAGENSVGRRLRVGADEVLIIGVLDHWRPLPRYYDLTLGALLPPEDVYMPFRLGINRQMRTSENSDCWPSYAGGFAGYLASECVWMNLWVEVDSPAERDAYRRFLDEYAMDQKQRGRFPQPLNNRLRTVGEWLIARHAISTDVKLQMLLSFAFLAVCLVNTVGLLLAKFLAHTREISVHRALGATRGQIFVRYLSEAAAVGLLGAMLGLVLTFGGTAAMRALDPTVESVARLDLPMTAATALLALISTLIAGALPAWRACRTVPAAFLKSE